MTSSGALDQGPGRHRADAGAPIHVDDPRLELALEAAGLGTFLVDLESGAVQYSPELAILLGFPGVHATTLEAAMQRVHREDHPRVRTLLDAAFDPAGDGRLRMELRYVRPGGDIRWMMWNGRVEFHDKSHGRVAFRILGACADITERKEAEARLRESEARFRSLVELSSDWYWEQDEEFRFTEFSVRLESLTNTPAAALIGKRRWELPTVHVSEQTWASHRALLARHEPFRDFEFQRINEIGEVIWVSLNGNPIFDTAGRFKGYRGTGQNITERKRAEALLKESEARFRLLADSAPVLIWVSGLKGAEFFNKPYLEFVGEAEGELEGMGWAAFLHPEDRASYLEAFAARAASRSQFEAQFRFRRADGEYRWMKSIGVPRFSADGRCLGYVGSTLDITDLKHNEERIALLARELDHRVKNILARFEVVVERTGDAPLAADAFAAALMDRIESMSRAHGLLSRSNWAGARLDMLISDQLEAYATDSNLQVCGEPLLVTPDAAQAISMVVNELATNAAKYGALSTTTGRVRVSWRRARGQDGQELLCLEWQERDGPPVATPERQGYGTSVIRELLVHEFSGEVELRIEPQGVTCTITLPIARVASSR